MKTILIIDDETMIRDLLKKALNKLDYTVLMAKNGAGGVAIFDRHSHEIDMAIVDMIMPDMSGAEAIYRMKAIDPNVVMVLSSGKSECEVQAAVEDVGANGYILKPFRVAQLSDTIETIFNSVEVARR